MSIIKVMSENLSNKIAAGEVVERISNVVKELVENSIDAKSTDIKVELKDSGKSFICVTDNGIGMEKEDAKLCFQRHATSKIYKDDDLFFINTLGFRGEALPSIASISEVVLETCNGVESTLIHLKGGSFIKEGICQARKGTIITITNLFYNTPARLKYLKSEPSELANVISFIEKLALSYPKISFTLFNNDYCHLKTSGSGNLLKAIHEIYGAEISKNMLEINGSNDDYDIRGYISKPIIQRKNKNHMVTFINGRLVKNYELNKYINEAYYTYKPDNTYPVVVLNIETDPTLIDVNIHPTKQDIKFSKLEELKDLVTKTIKEKLYSTLLIPSATIEENISNEFQFDLPKNLFVEESNNEYQNFSFKSFDDYKNEEERIDDLAFDFKKDEKNNFIKKLELYPVGIAFGTYIIAENSEGIYLIDQHAAKERVNYEKILKGLTKKDSIKMLLPLTIELTSSDYLIIKNNIDILINMGFEITEFGLNTFRIEAHPIWIKEGLEEVTIKKIFETLIKEEKDFNLDKFNDKVAATIACKASVKGNTRITLDAAKFILEELVLCDNPYNCPHGRPTIIKFTIYELEKMFKRVM